MVTVPKNWSAGRAWICVASLIAMQVALAFCVALFSYLVIGHPLNRQALVSFLLNAAVGLSAVFITLLFARPRTMQEFKVSFGLEKPKLQTALTLIASGAALAAVAVSLIKHGFAVPRNPLVESFSAPGSNGMAWLRVLTLASPFVEEFVVRGYVYPAFRQSYSITFSVVSIVAIAVLNHFASIMSSMVAAVSLIVLNVMLCLVREETGNLWYCVLCHLAYNLVCALT